ncbi:MAG: hypothetical protein PWR07_2296 [Bacillota bacterium]|nr:hypothetical protein [Bacillota bacterium]
MVPRGSTSRATWSSRIHPISTFPGGRQTATGRWSPRDQDLRVGAPWGTNPVRNLVTRDPPSWRSGHDDAGSGPQVTRLRAEMVPRGPTSSGAWSPRNHLARCPRTPGPQGTRICVWVVPRGSTSQATWSLVHHPRRQPRRPGHERTRTWCQAGPQRTIFTRELVPGAPPCRVLAKDGGRGGSRRTRSCAGLIPTGPGLPATWFCRDRSYSRLPLAVDAKQETTASPIGVYSGSTAC